MSWARLDDLFHGNRKVKRAWKQHRASIGLHVMAITYCAGHGTDGFVDTEFVEEKLPRASERNAATGALVDAGMWIPCDDGWSIHDFLDFHPSAIEEKERKESLSRVRSEAGRKGGQARSGKQTGKQTAGKLLPSNVAELSPVPTRPDQQPPRPPASGGRQRDRDLFEQECASFARTHLPHLRDGRTAVRQAVTYGKATTVEEVLTFAAEHFELEGTA